MTLAARSGAQLSDARTRNRLARLTGAAPRLILTPELASVLLDDRERKDGERQRILIELHQRHPGLAAHRR